MYEQYEKQIYFSTIIGRDSLIRPSVTYKKDVLNYEENNNVQTLSLNVPILDPMNHAYKPTELITKVWQSDWDQVQLYCYSTFLIVDENHI